MNNDYISCAFCEESKSGYLTDPILSMLAAPKIHRIIASNDSHFLVPSLGALTSGHLMLVTKEHFSAVRSMPYKKRLALNADLHRVHTAMVSNFETSIFIFEHGLASSEVPSQTCVDHVHIHLVPLSATVIKKVCANSPFETTTRLTELDESLFSNSYDYAIYGDDPNALKAFSSDSIESQFFRKMIAKELGRSDVWNWRDAPMLKHVIRDAKKLKKAQKWL